MSKRISRDRIDRLLLNRGLAQGLLSDLGYSGRGPKARAMSSLGWPAYLRADGGGRSAALFIAPNGRICKVEGSSIRTLGAIDLHIEHRGGSFVDAVHELEAAYLGVYPISEDELDRNRRMPSERQLAAAALEALRSAEAAGPEDGEQPGLQPGARDALDPVEALARARRRFASASPDPGTGYLATKRMVSPEVVRRFGADAGRWAVLRYDAERDEVMAAHRDAQGRFVGYEYRGGTAPANPKGSRGYASRCSPGFGILGEPDAACRLVLCESAVEALSLIEMEERADPDLVDRSAWLSCAGGPKGDQVERVSAWAARSDTVRVVLAYNADAAGEAFRTAVRGALAARGFGAERIVDLRPPLTDWNDALKAEKASPPPSFRVGGRI